MSNYSEHKPWYREDMGRIFASTYFLAQSGKTDRGVRLGIALVISSLCVAFGVDPMSFMKPEDAQMLKEGVR
jgi:hypothetical protein